MFASTLAVFASETLAAPCSQTVAQQRLTLSGSAGKQRLILDLDALGYVVASLDCNFDGDFTDAAAGDIDAKSFAGYDRIYIALNGNDTISINQNDDWTGVREDFQLFLSAGLNQVTYNSNGHAIGANSRILFEVAGGTGTDKINLAFGDTGVDQSALLIRADMGSGDDSFTLGLPGTTDTGELTAEVKLGPGANAFTLTQGAATTQGQVSVDIEGGVGIETVTLNPTAIVSRGRTHVSAFLGEGNDRFVTNLDLALFDLASDANLFLSVDGSGGNDFFAVTRNGTTPINTQIADTANFDVRLRGGPGKDAMTIDLGAGGIDQFTGATIRLRADGGAGNDTMTFTLDSADAGAPFGPGQYDVAVTGGLGNDILNVTHNAAGAVTYLQGAMILDGGAGTVDTCTVGGSSSASLHLLNCE